MPGAARFTILRYRESPLKGTRAPEPFLGKFPADGWSCLYESDATEKFWLNREASIRTLDVQNIPS